jgi:arylformamidase
MIATVELRDKTRKVNFSKPLDLSIPLRAGTANVNAWYVGPMTIEPVMTEHFTGSVLAGGTVNFRNIFFNPHGNGTHTECVGHISREVYTINQILTRFFFEALVVTIDPETLTEANGFQQIGDVVITLAQIKAALGSAKPEAIAIRTLPNPIAKHDRQYSNTNPPYLDHEAAIYLRNNGVDHLMIDLPSVDAELDDGRMLSHKAFWEYPENTQAQRTISELIYVPNEIEDGEYLLNMQIASFENDASPSKPILYKYED